MTSASPTFGPRCDFHSHTTASDGSLSPRQLVEQAVARGVTTLALTDHDTTAGVAQASAAAEELGLKLLPGVECTCESAKIEVHLLGLGVDPANAQLQEFCATMRTRRLARFKRMHELLTDYGLRFELPELSDKVAATRPLMAKLIVEAGIARDQEDAFARFLRRGRPGFVPNQRDPVSRAIDVVPAAGGVAVLAHPGIYGGAADATIDEAYDSGVDGIECVHPDHDAEREFKFTQRARRQGLLISGGADFHGLEHARAHWFGKKFCPPSEAVRIELALATAG